MIDPRDNKFKHNVEHNSPLCSTHTHLYYQGAPDVRLDAHARKLNNNTRGPEVNGIVKISIDSSTWTQKLFWRRLCGRRSPPRRRALGCFCSVGNKYMRRGIYIVSARIYVHWNAELDHQFRRNLKVREKRMRRIRRGCLASSKITAGEMQPKRGPKPRAP